MLYANEPPRTVDPLLGQVYAGDDLAFTNPRCWQCKKNMASGT